MLSPAEEAVQAGSPAFSNTAYRKEKTIQIPFSIFLHLLKPADQKTGCNKYHQTEYFIFSHAFCYHRPESIHQYCCWHTRRYSLYCLGQKYLRQKAACCKMADSRHQKQEQNSPRQTDSRKSPLQKAAADRSVNTDKAMIFANSKDNRCFTGIWSITTAALTPGRVMQKSRKLNPRIRPAVLIPGPIPAPSRLSLIPLFHGRRKPATDNTEKSKTSTLALIP